MTLRKDPKMHRPLIIVQFCDDTKKYPQNLLTPKMLILLKTLKNIEFKILKPPINDPSLRMYENIRVPPPPLGPSLPHFIENAIP